MSVHKKLMQARLELQGMKLNKSGHNKFAGYQYFELGDFLPVVQKIFSELGLCGLVSFSSELATLTITDIEDASNVVISSPMGSAALKGCHEVQNIGAVETYQRRYLWVTAMEIVEHDALDATTGNENKGKGAITPTSGAMDTIPASRLAVLEAIKASIIDYFNNGNVREAHNIFYEIADNEEKTAVWAMLVKFSKIRSAIKDYHESIKPTNMKEAA